jgi:hypothetical protein
MIDDDWPVKMPGSVEPDPLPKIDELVLRIRGLVRVHEHLRQRGMTSEVLARHAAEIDRLQTRLAEQVRLSVTEPSG